MRKMLACFANVQEGRNEAFLRELVHSTAVPGAVLVRLFSDRVYHRSGFLILGTPAAVGESAFALTKHAVTNIDLASRSRAEDGKIHHHIGACDLLPFYPLGTSTLAEAGEVASSVARRLGNELNIPVLTYGTAHASRRSLVELRKTTRFFAAATETKETEQLQFDFGPQRTSPSTGISVVGVSEYVVNFNVVLLKVSMKEAKAIAAKIRATSPGGLEGVEVMAYHHEHLGEAAVEVACNLKASESATGSCEAVERRIEELVQELGSGGRLSHAYMTNPSRKELDAMVATMLGESQGSPSVEFRWDTPPGHEPFSM
jgi:glutamate formiminotransferase